jgi:hypothetical protein
MNTRTYVHIDSVLDENPSTTNPTWFPRSIKELDCFATRVLDAGEDLQSDHPGFTDPTYRERRKYFAKVAIEYKHGTPIPHVHYTAEVRRVLLPPPTKHRFFSPFYNLP